MLKRLIIATGCLALLATSVSPALAGWGCHARDAEGYNNFSWGADSEDAARDYTMKRCAGRNHRGCHIVECRSGVDDQERAYAMWLVETRTTKCAGRAKC
jgi:hypothetical protein